MGAVYRASSPRKVGDEITVRVSFSLQRGGYFEGEGVILVTFDDQLEVRSVMDMQRDYLQVTRVDDAGLDHLKELTTLDTLDLGSTQLTDATLEQLKGLTTLHELELDGTRVADAGLEHLKGMTSLHRLALKNTQVTNAGLKHLKELTSLRVLDLRDTQVTDEGLKKLQEALPECKMLL